MIATLVFGGGLIVTALIAFGTWISALKQADVDTLTFIPIAKALALPLIWVAGFTAVIVTGFGVIVAAQFAQLIP
jgi:hypothetical protein